MSGCGRAPRGPLRTGREAPSGASLVRVRWSTCKAGTPERYRSAHLLTTALVVLCSRFQILKAKLEAHGKRLLWGSERPLRGLSALRGYGNPVTKSPLSKSAPPAPRYRFLGSPGSGMGGALRHTPQWPLVIGQN